MLRRPTQHKDYDPEQYLRDADNRFLFDPESGIYKPKTYYKEKKRKNFKIFSLSLFKWGTLLLSALTLFYLFKYTNYARLQWCEMQRANAKAGEAIQEARNAQILSKQQFQDDQRPYVWLNDEQGPFNIVNISNSLKGRLAWNFGFTNYGKSPAINLHSEGFIVFGDGSWKKLKWPSLDGQGGAILPPGKKDFNTAFSESAVDPALLGKLSVPGIMKPVEILGRIQYYDTQGKLYKSEFCLGRSPNPPVFYRCPYANGLNP